MDIQCTFEYWAGVEMPITERLQRRYEPTTYKHAVALETSFEINK